MPAFQLREPRSRRTAQHTHLDELMVASWAPVRTLSGPRGRWAFELHVCGDSHDLLDKVYLAGMASGDQSQENMGQGPRKQSICTQTDNHEDSLSVSTRSVI